jgi:hypothetical protein
MTPVVPWRFELGSTVTSAWRYGYWNGPSPTSLTLQRAIRLLGFKRLRALPDPADIKRVMPLTNRGLCPGIFRSQHQGNTEHEYGQNGLLENTTNPRRTQRGTRHAIKIKLIQVY